MDKEILKRLVKEHGKLCVSVITPLKNSPREGAQNPLLMDRIIKFAKDELKHKLNSKAEKYTARLENMKKKLDFKKSPKGVGLFMSNSLEEIVFFQSDVTEKVVMGERFELRDIRYELQDDMEYCVLNLTEKVIRLYKCKGNDFSEIKDKNFPKEFVDSYEYERPSLGSSVGYSLKSTEKDKSNLEEKRIEAFFRSVDNALSVYLKGETPLIISGLKKEIALFKRITHFEKNLAGLVNGNYSLNPSRLFHLAAEEMKNETNKRNLLELQAFKESGNAKVVTGLQRVWKAAKEGKGLKLFVEKDFQKPAFVGKDEYKLLVRPPAESHRIISDVVDEIIEIVISKRGKVIQVEKGTLKDYEHIGMLLRYNE